MPNVVRHPVFAEWLGQLRDERAFAQITLRLNRLALGNPGDVKSIGGGLSEMRVDSGPGYRIYLTRRGQDLVILLCGGSKSSQKRDIEKARYLLKTL